MGSLTRVLLHPPSPGARSRTSDQAVSFERAQSPRALASFLLPCHHDHTRITGRSVEHVSALPGSASRCTTEGEGTLAPRERSGNRHLELVRDSRGLKSTWETPEE
jgi:hypothetical protein